MNNSPLQVGDKVWNEHNQYGYVTHVDKNIVTGITTANVEYKQSNGKNINAHVNAETWRSMSNTPVIHTVACTSTPKEEESNAKP